MSKNKNSIFVLIHTEMANPLFNSFYSDEDFHARLISEADCDSKIFINHFFEAVIVGVSEEKWPHQQRFIEVVRAITPWVPVIIVVPENFLPPVEYADHAGIIPVVFEEINYDRLKLIITNEVERRKKRMNIVFTMPENFTRYNALLDFINSVLAGEDAEEIMSAIARRLTEEFPGMITTFLEYSHSNTFYCCAANTISTELVDNLKNRVFGIFRDLGGETINPNKILIRTDFLSPDSAANDMFHYLCAIPVLEDDRLTGLLTISANRARQHAGEQEIIVIFALMRQLCMLLRTFNHIRSRMIHDSLSGLYDHQYFQRSMRVAVENAREKDTCLTLMLMDIDRFKNFNDSYGHFIGDEVIRDFARLIKSHSRDKDIVARFGGDEFAMIMPDTSHDEARQVTTLLLEKVRGHVFKNCGHPLTFTISIGLATTRDPGISNVSTLFEAADAALYLAKKNGRNQYCSNHEMIRAKSPVAAAVSIIGKAFKRPSPALEQAEKTLGRILIVDDNQEILVMLQTLLQRKKYHTDIASNGIQALEKIKAAPENIDLIISDINMPGMNGLELIQAIHNVDPNLVVILLTGFATVTNSMTALKAGAFRIIKKPFELDEMLNAVESGVERCMLKRRLDAYHIHLEELLQNKTKALQLAVDQLKDSYVKTMTTIVSILDAYEQNTATHSQMVSILSVRLAREMGIDNEEELNNIKYGSLLHDIGKIGISSSILNKPAKLSEEEMNLVKKHPEIGYEIARNIPFLADACDIIHQHHEHFDGSGYPAGLQGQEICIGARLFAVIDAFEAMRSNKRCYKKGMSLPDVIAEINRCSGTQFDPEIVKVFNNCCENLNSLFEKYHRMADAENESLITADFISQSTF